MIRSSGIFFTLLLCGLLAGCDAPGSGGAATATPGETMFSALFGDGSFREVAFLTLRNRTGDNRASDYFGDDRSILASGYCDVSRTPVKPLQSISENSPFHISDEILALDSIREQPRELLLEGLGGSQEGLRPLLYTHGYYISFERGCKRASMLQRSLGFEGRFLLFSWPSDGALLNYTRDESDLYWSVSPMADTLVEMARIHGAGGFDVAAHSLGTRGVFLALLLLAGDESAPRPLVNQLVLLAPDIDAGIFEQNLARVRPMAENITIYVSSNDKPLAVSRQVHGYPRLGEAGRHLDGLEGVDIIDLSDIGVRYPSGHVYHLYHPGVVNDLAELLTEGNPAAKRGNLERTGHHTWRLRPEAVVKPADSD